MIKNGRIFRKVANRIISLPSKRHRIFYSATDTLDNIIKESGLNQINLIKMDIQGAEYDALQGCLKTLKRNKPLLLVELHKRRHWKQEDLLNLLKDLGYKLTMQDVHKDILVRAIQ